MNYTKISKIDKGWSSYIWLAKSEKGTEVILKEEREKSPRKGLCEREGKMLALANSVKVGPKLFEVNEKENFVAMEYIKGQEFLRWLNKKEFENVTKKEMYEFLKEIYRQLLRLNKVNLSHNQVSGGRNILVTETYNEKKERKFVPTIIDFETAKIRISPKKTKNLGQADDYFFQNKYGFAARKVREKLEIEL